LDKALAKAGNIRLLESNTQISRSTLSSYHLEKRAVKKENLDKLVSYARISFNEREVIKKLPDNWRQIRGGKKCVELKKKRGTYEKQLKRCQRASSEYMKLLHKKMKANNPYEYYLMQYEKFKKVGKYKFVTKKGDRVRNMLEKEVADLLKSMKIHYEYEPLIEAGGKFFFPDFLINNKIIIECTEWRGFDKAIKLKNKIKFLKKKYKVYVVIPKTLKRYYGILNQHLLLGIDDLRQVLQKSG